MSGAVLSLIGVAGSGGGSGTTTITVTSQYLESDAVDPNDATTILQLKSDGTTNESLNGGAFTLVENWCVPGSQAPNYECYVTLVYGALGSGSAALNTWLPLSTTRQWRVTQTVLGFTSATLNLGIRRVGETAIVSGTITIAASVTT